MFTFRGTNAWNAEISCLICFCFYYLDDIETFSELLVNFARYFTFYELENPVLIW